MKMTWTFAILVLLLTACADHNDESEVTEPQAAADPVADAFDTTDLAEMARSDPEGFREALRDPERRQAAMDTKREQRGEVERDPQQHKRREEMRERMRQRREELIAEREGLEPGERMRDRRAGARESWWEDETIVGNLGLEEHQAKSLGQAHQSLNEVRRQSRQNLARGQRLISQALQDADREQIQTLLEERHAATLALAEAERDWLNALLEQLSDEQLSTLASEHPRALTPRRR